MSNDTFEGSVRADDSTSALFIPPEGISAIRQGYGFGDDGNCSLVGAPAVLREIPYGTFCATFLDLDAHERISGDDLARYLSFSNLLPRETSILVIVMIDGKSPQLPDMQDAFAKHEVPIIPIPEELDNPGNWWNGAFIIDDFPPGRELSDVDAVCYNLVEGLDVFESNFSWMLSFSGNTGNTLNAKYKNVIEWAGFLAQYEPSLPSFPIDGDVTIPKRPDCYRKTVARGKPGTACRQSFDFLKSCLTFEWLLDIIPDMLGVALPSQFYHQFEVSWERLSNMVNAAGLGGYIKEACRTGRLPEPGTSAGGELLAAPSFREPSGFALPEQPYSKIDEILSAMRSEEAFTALELTVLAPDSAGCPSCWQADSMEYGNGEIPRFPGHWNWAVMNMPQNMPEHTASVPLASAALLSQPFEEQVSAVLIVGARDWDSDIARRIVELEKELVASEKAFFILDATQTFESHVDKVAGLIDVEELSLLNGAISWISRPTELPELFDMEATASLCWRVELLELACSNRPGSLSGLSREALDILSLGQDPMLDDWIEICDEPQFLKWFCALARELVPPCPEDLLAAARRIPDLRFIWDHSVFQDSKSALTESFPYGCHPAAALEMGHACNIDKKLEAYYLGVPAGDIVAR